MKLAPEAREVSITYRVPEPIVELSSVFQASTTAPGLAAFLLDQSHQRTSNHCARSHPVLPGLVPREPPLLWLARRRPGSRKPVFYSSGCERFPLRANSRSWSPTRSLVS